MATLQQIANDALVELRFGSGQDVQIHLQEGLFANISRLYRTLMKKHVWRDYYLTNSYVTNADGQVTASLSNTLTRFSNIIAVYLEEQTEPLPTAPVRVNPARMQRPVIVHSGGEKVFTIWPKQERNIILLSKFYSEDDFAADAEVPFYRDILALGAAYMLGVKSGTNDALTGELKKQFYELVDMYVMAEMQDTYQTNTRRGSIPLDWYETPNG